ncbi:helix-turn-helix domain-containing protein [Streptomyces xiamenensis]|uniref:helix-turn-helix domain-containing protein n=1 Tax=Streptomyces xiamenensis TaxID=408015 RepID=UPI0036E3414D
MSHQLGPLLRGLRQRSGMTQEQLAERSGVSVSTIRRLENGRSADHRLGTVNLLADALEAEPEDRRALTDTLSGGRSVPAEPVPEPAPVVRAPAPRGPAPGSALAEAVDALATEVGRRWRREEAQRRVHDPFPLPVRWRAAPGQLMDHTETVQRVPPGGASPDVDLRGEVATVAETYRRIPSGRLVVLGRAGSGKSILAIRLVLDLLATRAAPERVPVIISVGSWDPETTSLRDLLIDRLLRDHPHLARHMSSGATQAAALVDAELILPVLDGFDEIAESLRGPALRELNTTSLPLVLTSRRAEFDRAVHAAHTPLIWAAGIELTGLTPDDLAGYLPRTVRPVTRPRGPGGPDSWQDVIGRLRDPATPGEEQLAHVLSTPLMVVLARTLYSDVPGRNPADLLSTERFPTRGSLEEHLLAGFVPAAYRPEAPDAADAGRRSPRTWDPDRAQHWLGYLADSLHRSGRDQQDLAWWRIGASRPRAARVLHVAVASALCVAAAAWIVTLLVLLLTPGGSWDAGAALVESALLGTLAGTAFGAVHGLLIAGEGAAIAPARVRLAFPRAGRGAVHRPLRTVARHFGLLTLGGGTVGAGYAGVMALQAAYYQGRSLTDPALLRGTLINMLVLALVFGAAAGLILGLLALFEAPVDISAAAGPVPLLISHRTTVLRQALIIAPTLALGIGLGGHLAVHLLQGPLGPLRWSPRDGLLTGAVSGLGGTAAYSLAFTAWGQWLTVCRIWLPLRGRLPRDPAAFLEDAYRRGVLRRSGAVYQFRHLRLQQHLARSFRQRHSARPEPAGAQPGRWR